MIVKRTCSLPDEQRSIVRTPAGSCTRGSRGSMATTDAARRSIPETRACSPKTSPGPMNRARADVSLAGHGLDQAMAGLQQKTACHRAHPPGTRTHPVRCADGNRASGPQGLRSGTDPPESAIPYGQESMSAPAVPGDSILMSPPSMEDPREDAADGNTPSGAARGGGGPHGQLRGRRPGRNLRRVMGTPSSVGAPRVSSAPERGRRPHDDVRRAAGVLSEASQSSRRAKISGPGSPPGPSPCRNGSLT